MSEPNWQSLRDIMADKTPSALDREIDARPRWRVYYRAKDFPAVTIPAMTESEARRIALLISQLPIRMIERVSPEER